MPEGSQGGLRGRSQGVVDPKFQNRLDDQKAVGDQNYKAFRAEMLRRWNLPPELVTDLCDIENLHVPAHVRDDLNTLYRTITRDTENAGSTGDVIAIDYQIDWLAAEERALRARHSGVCRELAHGASREYGFKQSRIFDAMREQAEKMIQAGGAAH